MSFTITNHTNQFGDITHQTAEGRLVSSVNTNVIFFPPSFIESTASTAGQNIFIGFPDQLEFSFSQVLSNGTLALSNSTTNPLKFLITYKPLQPGHHEATLVFQDIATGEQEVLLICGKFHDGQIELDIIDSKEISTLSIVDGVATSRVELVDGVRTKIII